MPLWHKKDEHPFEIVFVHISHSFHKDLDLRPYIKFVVVSKKGNMTISELPTSDFATDVSNLVIVNPVWFLKCFRLLFLDCHRDVCVMR